MLDSSKLKRHEFNNQPVALDIETFRKRRTQTKGTTDPFIRRNQTGKGIPQGSPISSTLSNIYMMDFDKKMNGYVTGRKGIYRRYSDDFVIVIPQHCFSYDPNKLWIDIKNMIDRIPGLDLQPEKTNIFTYDKGILKNITDKIFTNATSNEHVIHYLGFSFDGHTITIRQKAIQKFYSRMYRKIKTVNKYSEKYQRNVFRRRLFNRYSHLGKRKTKKNRGNFLTYVEKAQKRFIDEPINNQVRNHWKRLNNMLIKIK